MMVYSVDQAKTWRGVPNNWPLYFLPSTYWMRILSDSAVKNLPTKPEMQVWSQGQGDPQEKEMATYSSILAWEIPWTEEPGGLQSTGSQRVRHDLGLNNNSGYQGSPRLRDWVTYPFSNGSSWPRNRTRVSCIAGGFFTSWATRWI